MTLYFNEHDRFAAQWLRNLYPDATVDERDIRDVTADDVVRFRRVHFFGGVAGWQYALDLAEWGDEEIWTGSCPCQPFSSAGKRKGVEDERHLWPAWFRLIRECRPHVVVGEQVESAIGHGWLDGVSADLEAEGYAVGAAVLGAHSVGAPHVRQRLFWVADDGNEGLEGRTVELAWNELPAIERSGDAGGTAVAHVTELQRITSAGKQSIQQFGNGTFIACRDGRARRVATEPGIQPLAHGIPRDLGRRIPELRRVAASARANRVGRLRGYGNAIVPQVAATFIRAFMETRGDQ